jgi:hypothetical protein
MAALVPDGGGGYHLGVAFKIAVDHVGGIVSGK